MTMTMERYVYLHRGLLAVQACMAVLIFFSLVWMGRSGQVRKVVLRAYENVCMQARVRRGRFWSYEKWERYLRENGAKYHYGKWISPVSFTAVRIVCAVLGGMIGIYRGPAWCAAMLCLGFWLPVILLEYLNRRDNEVMLSELDLVYSALVIQIRAGVYVTDALSEVYSAVRQERLREGLEQLGGDIVMKADLDDALERFQSCFNNRYIDTLCITILQAVESGQAVELLGDIAEQIRDMEVTLQNRKKEQLNRSVTFYQLFLFAAVLAVVIYACVSQLFSVAL